MFEMEAHWFEVGKILGALICSMYNRVRIDGVY